MTNKTTLKRLKLDPYFSKTIETNLNVWSHDQNSYEIKFEFYDHQCDKPIDLTGADMRILLDHAGSQPKIYPLEIESKVLGLAKFIMPEQIRGCEGKFTAHIYADYPNKTHDFGSFTFYTQLSKIDKSMDGCLDTVYVSEFEKALEKFKEIEQKIKDNNLVNYDELGSFAYSKQEIDSKSEETNQEINIIKDGTSKLNEEVNNLNENKMDKEFSYTKQEVDNKIGAYPTKYELSKELSKKRSVSTKITSFDMDTSSDHVKLRLDNMGEEVLKAISGNAEISPILKIRSVDNMKITDSAVDARTTNFITIGNNLFDRRKIKHNTFIDINGNVRESDKYFVFGPVFINGELTVSVSSNTGGERGFRFITLYDNDGSVLKGKGLDDMYIKTNTFTIDNNIGARYMFMTFPNEYIGNAAFDLMINYGEPKKYEQYYEKLDDYLTLSDKQILALSETLKLDKNLNGKVLYSLGDSIAQAPSGSKSYADLIADEYNMKLTKFSVGGATFSEETDNNIVKQVESMWRLDRPDYILLNGMTNDILNCTKGEVSADYEGQYNTKTSVGAMERILYSIKNTWPETKVIFVRVHKMSSRNMEKQQKFMSDALAVCEKWSVPVADIYREGQMNTFVDNMRKKYTIIKTSTGEHDGTHPNLEGYTKHYVPQILEKMI